MLRFGGFLDRRFRVHDYVLGRMNCQQFLRRSFSLPLFDPPAKSDRYVHDRFGNNMSIVYMQGGVFSTDGSLLYLSNGSAGCVPDDGIKVFELDAGVGFRIAIFHDHRCIQRDAPLAAVAF